MTDFFQKRHVLQPLAFTMMYQGRREMSLEEICHIIQVPLAHIYTGLQPFAFVQLIENSSGLLLEREQDVYSFAHLTFQEYLATVHIKEEGLDGMLAEHIGDSWWHETIRLYCAQADATAIITACLEKKPTSVSALTLAFECQEEALKVQPSVRKRFEDWLHRDLDEMDVDQRRLNQPCFP